MPDIEVSQLPIVGSVDPTDTTIVIHGGVLSQGTVASFSASNLTQTFLTLNAEPTLTSSRRVAFSGGLTAADGGAGSTYTVSTTGNLSALNSIAAAGVVAYNGSTMVGRTLTGTTDQIDVANGDGSGVPTFSIAANAILPGTGGQTLLMLLLHLIIL